MSDNIFERASVLKLRYPSPKGELTVENLWDLPLQGRNGSDLDSIAKAVNATLKALGEESFVSSSPNPDRARQQLALDIVRHVINVKLNQKKDATERAAREAKRELLKATLEKKQADELSSLSTEELARQLAALSD